MSADWRRREALKIAKNRTQVDALRGLDAALRAEEAAEPRDADAADAVSRGVAAVQQVHHYLSPANLRTDGFLRGEMDPATGFVRHATLATFPQLAAIGVGDADLAHYLRHSQVVELDAAGTAVRPKRAWRAFAGRAHVATN